MSIKVNWGSSIVDHTDYIQGSWMDFPQVPMKVTWQPDSYPPQVFPPYYHEPITPQIPWESEEDRIRRQSQENDEMIRQLSDNWTQHMQEEAAQSAIKEQKSKRRAYREKVKLRREAAEKERQRILALVEEAMDGSSSGEVKGVLDWLKEMIEGKK